MNTSAKTPEENTKSRIFRIAARLFSERGFNGVSMREISEKSGVSKPTIYYYFKSKEGIYTELVDTGISHIFSSVENIRQMDISVKEKLVLIAQHFFRQSLQNPDFVRFFLKISTSPERVPFLEKLKKQADKKGRTFIKMIQEGKDTGEFGPSVNPKLAAGIIGGTLGHFIWQQFSSNKKILSDQLAEDIIEMLFKGLNE